MWTYAYVQTGNFSEVLPGVKKTRHHRETGEERVEEGKAETGRGARGIADVAGGRGRAGQAERATDK